MQPEFKHLHMHALTPAQAWVYMCCNILAEQRESVTHQNFKAGRRALAVVKLFR